MSDTVTVLNWMQIGFGGVVIILAFVQVMFLRQKKRVLRIAVYTALGLMIGGIAFGKYYAKEAPKRFEPIEASKPSVAFAGYTDAIQLSPSNAELYYRRGRTDFYLAKFAQAVADFTNALRLSPNNPKYLLGRAFAFVMLKDMASAEQDLNLAISSGYQSSEASLLQGIIADKHGRRQEAILQFTAALSGTDSKQYRCAALFGRGYDYHFLGMNEKALADYSAVIDSCKGNGIEAKYERASALTNRAFLQWNIFQKETAFSDWEAAIKLDPTNATALFDRAVAFQQIGDLMHALLDVNRYIELRPDEPDGWKARSSIYLALANRKQATSDLEHAQDLITTGRARQYGATIQTPFGPIISDDPVFRR